MRLDVVLVQRSLLSSRHRAKHAIQTGLVRVAGRVVRQPAFEVRGDEAIEVASGADRPKAYWKLQEIDRATRLFHGVASVLDLGSSGGGFLLYAAERCERVVGVEMSREFEPLLERVKAGHPHVELVWGDAFRTPVEGTFDLLLNDLTLDVDSSLKATGLFIDQVAPEGGVLQVLKGELPAGRAEGLAAAREWFAARGFATGPPMEFGMREAYLVAKRSSI